ncbi:GerAB/ArcD/ProY family transporter [Bacillus taeanensis]|uniref:Uncharacterized protein n=1 Tax=Bacillus taeanensis TaxID=273032 RepID=A0A366XQA6_9BACI|nr:GerAB/ArcD/ProY family transporter [Bacillus taeanensis]RBW68097.1 hypothetical protein DS031_18655 [Bacillus taeanensis]
MEKAKISAIQLFVMMFIFEMGTAVVISYGAEARKDAWLAILLAMCGGIVLFFIYYFLFRHYPNLSLIGYARKAFGKYLGWIIGLLYILFFLYISARNVREFGDLLLSSTLPQTPLFAINSLFVLIMCYVLYLGIEVVGRTAEVFIVILFFLGGTGNLLILLSGNVSLDNLWPFLEDGWKPILTTAFPNLLVFPFAELLVFTMLLPYLNRPKLVKKVWLSVLILSSVVLSWTASLNIAVLGIDRFERSTFPLLSTMGMVNIAEFLQRLDAIVVLTMLITVFFKASIYLYGTVIGMVELFKLKNHQQILLLTGVILIFWSLMAPDTIEHYEEGIFTHYIAIPLHMVIPLLMLLVSLIRNHFKKKSN